MAPYYNNPYQTYPSMNYQQMNTPTYQPPVMPQTNSGITWVQGEAGAKAYPVAAGNSILLMDSESESFYIKTTDASGIPQPLRTFHYSEIVNTAPSYALPDFNPDEYAKKSDIEHLKEEMTDELKQMFMQNGMRVGGNQNVQQPI